MSAGPGFELQGVLKSWNDERGFGFLSMPDGSRPLFVHVSSFIGLSGRPKVGDSFSFSIAAGKDGQTRAVRVRRFGGPSRSVAHTSGPRSRARLRLGPAILAPLALVVLGVILNLVWAVPVWVPVVYLGMSLICNIAYAVDKRAANRGGWRTPETTLHFLELIGGWPGAVLAQQFLHHKSRKASYQRTFWLVVVINVLAFIAVVAIGSGGVLDRVDLSWINR